MVQPANLTEMKKEKNDFTQVAEISISYYPKVAAKNRIKIKTSAEAVALLRSSWNPGTIGLLEEFKIILLNRTNKVLGIAPISKGGRSGTMVDTSLIYGIALKCAASGIIPVHNHPSGNTQPSEEDKKLTYRLVAAGKLLDIQVLDHLILTPEGYFSFADEGLF